MVMEFTGAYTCTVSDRFVLCGWTDLAVSACPALVAPFSNIFSVPSRKKRGACLLSFTVRYDVHLSSKSTLFSFFFLLGVLRFVRNGFARFRTQWRGSAG